MTYFTENRHILAIHSVQQRYSIYLLKDAVSSSDYLAPYDGMINE
jgi:hypothetical protein